VLVGRQDPVTAGLVKKLGLQDVVQCVGRVSYEESLRYIASASVCVLVEGKMAEGIYYPSKLADYVAARKPVLAMSPADGVVAELSRERGIFRMDADDEESIARAISEFHQAYLSARLHEMGPSEVLVRYVSPGAVVDELLSLAESVCQE